MYLLLFALVPHLDFTDDPLAIEAVDTAWIEINTWGEEHEKRTQIIFWGADGHVRGWVMEERAEIVRNKYVVWKDYIPDENGKNPRRVVRFGHIKRSRTTKDIEAMELRRLPRERRKRLFPP